MEAICVKLDERILKNIDLSMKNFNYTTRTDFIREAIRDKLSELEKESAIKDFKKFMGSAKSSVSDERHEQIREEVAKEYAKKFGL
ncbi:MAG: ribbon-helix-helix domain-containing protein [Candidatus Woesearchaeota archaeon]|nr:ribbon-helix-helix domain-containing protein [Candidatus Woesearchaeota archaeon]